MKITNTKIPDISPYNLSNSKINLANSIVNSIFPLFDEIYHGKINEEKGLKSNILSLKTKIKEEKTEILKNLKHLKKEQKVSKLLEKIEKLVTSGLIYDSTVKRETVILLKVLDKLPENKVDEHLTKAMQLITKRFSNIA
jgi:hypothetical protein